MEKRSSKKHPNLLTPEERRLQLIQYGEVSQRSLFHGQTFMIITSPSRIDLSSNESCSSFNKGKQNDDGSPSTQKSLQLPPIILVNSSSQYSSETSSRGDNISKNQNLVPFTSKNQRIERENNTAYPDLFTLLENYKNDSIFLKFSLSKKIKEDRRKTEEAKFKHNYLDYLLSLDLADSISVSSSKTTTSATTVEEFEKSTFSFCKPFRPESSTSGNRRSIDSFMYDDNSNGDLMTNSKRSHHQNIQIPALNLEYINAESTPQRSDTGETLKSGYYQSITQLYSPYEIQNKRNRATEGPSTSWYQTTHKGLSCNHQRTSKLSLSRKNSDPICLGIRSISKIQSSPDVSAPYLKIPKFSRHLSIPDLQYSSNSSSASNSKDLTALLLPIPANLTPLIRRSASPSTSSELSSQSSVYSNKKSYEITESSEGRKSFDFEINQQLHINQTNLDNDEKEKDQFDTPIPTNKERTLLPKFKVYQDSHHTSNTPSQSKNRLSPPISIESQEGRSSSHYSKLKGKKREMHAITMIVETTEFPYQDYYSWKNNGNTIHKSSGQKSIYYKCSNCIESCPVNKTVMFREDGSYLIKYRGKHIDKCNKEKTKRAPS